MVVAVVASLGRSGCARLEGAGDGWRVPWSWAGRCAAGFWAARSPGCCTVSQGCVWSEGNSILTMLSCRTETGSLLVCLPRYRVAIALPLPAAPQPPARGRGMKNVGGACTEGEAVVLVCIDLGRRAGAPHWQPCSSGAVGWCSWPVPPPPWRSGHPSLEKSNPKLVTWCLLLNVKMKT